VDDFKPGYPKFAALLDIHAAFQNFRRFSRARLRLLLLKQDELSGLEAPLDRIDAQEQRTLFLGCARRDENTERRDVLARMKISLSEYDTMMRDYHRAMRLPDADPRDVNSIKNWMDGTGCIAPAKSEFLERRDDLANLGGTLDSAVNYIEIVVEKLAFRLAAHIRKVTYPHI
ncbi:hypothetical protein EJ02DRAFT_348290, partial [Clathrospora elynae]